MLLHSALALATVALGATPAAPVVVIEHFGPVPTAEGLSLEARIVSTAGLKVFDPAAFVRVVGSGEFQRLPMVPVPGDKFRAALPPALAAADCEYFLEAFDEEGNGPFRKGSPDKPLKLSRPAPARPLPDLPKAPPAPTPPAAVQGEPGRPLRTSGIALVAGGGALLVGGAISGFLALDSYNREKATSDPVEYESAKSAAKTEALVADVLFAVGGAAAVLGAILWANDPVPLPAAQGVKVSAAPVPGGACALVSGRF